MPEPASIGVRNRLPRGPHGLSRQEVEQSQRERLLFGATEAVAAKGYSAASVADILRYAGVSRTTFYQLFDDKLECFLAACEMASAVVASVMADELARIEADGVTSPMDKLDHLLGAYLQSLSDNPDLARVFLVEVYAAGPQAIRQRRDSLEQFVDLVATTHRDSQGLLGTAPEQRFAAEVLVAAVSSKATTAVGLGEAEQLVSLREPLMDFAARFFSSDHANAAPAQPHR